MKKEQTETSSADLATLCKALLELHKELLAYERRNYETVYGDIGSNGNYLTLIMSHPTFSWLRKLSGLIATIDEILDPMEKNPIDRSPRDVVFEIEKLLSPDEQGDEFSQKYHAAIHHEPNVAIAHGQAMIEIKKMTVT